MKQQTLDLQMDNNQTWFWYGEWPIMVITNVPPMDC